MKKTLFTWALLLGFTPLLIQCVAQEKDVAGLDLRMRTMDAQLIDMERSVQAMKNQAGYQAELSNTIDKMNNRILQLEGRVDERIQHGKKTQEESKDLKNLVNNRLDAIDIQVKELNTRLGQLTEQVAQNSQNVLGIKEARAHDAATQAAAAAKEAEAARARAEKTSNGGREIAPDQVKKKSDDKPQTEAKAETPPAAVEKPEPAAKADKPEKSSGSGKELYDKGVALFKDKKYKESYNAFADYLAKHPKGEMAANARFWLGDCLYQQKEYELAILEYQKVIADFGQTPKAPAALLKQAMAFEELKEPETAKIVYNKVLEDYPKSEQADAAKKRLQALKK